MAVEAIKEGARDFLTKPITDFQKLKALLDDANREIELRRKTKKLAASAEADGLFGEFVGASKPMRDVFSLIEMVASRDVPVIVTGESGTGKELVARAVHRLSARNGKPFIAVNAAAIPDTLIESEVFGHERGAFTGAVGTRPGCFEQAHGGTLFLDEIAEMPSALQPKLLRVLADGKVRRLGGSQEFAFDVRVVVATNRNPLDAIREGRLREDLYYRLNVFSVALPALRDRQEDIPLLAQRFIQEFNRKHHLSIEGISEDSASLLQAYAWPGNVRELRNVIERAVVLAKSEWIESATLPPYIRDAARPTQKLVLDVGAVTMADAERELLTRTLELTGNNKAEAARQLGVDVKTIYNKVKAYKIES
jgi:DNA-binding NtrC family response regulator